jgi:dolichyl-diphosphooligosaccharide--protein glycosyltransferase
MAQILPFFKQSLEFLILCLACTLAFLPRLLSVLRYESGLTFQVIFLISLPCLVIHEFDPYFNYRSTQYLVKEGIYAFHNWFDEMAWYPLGRIVGGTVYPGLMWSAALVYKVCEYLGFPIDVRNSCVFVSPIWASFTVWITYMITKVLYIIHSLLIITNSS